MEHNFTPELWPNLPSLCVASCRANTISLLQGDSQTRPNYDITILWLHAETISIHFYVRYRVFFKNKKSLQLIIHNNLSCCVVSCRDHALSCLIVLRCVVIIIYLVVLCCAVSWGCATNQPNPTPISYVLEDSKLENFRIIEKESGALKAAP